MANAVPQAAGVVAFFLLLSNLIEDVLDKSKREKHLYYKLQLVTEFWRQKPCVDSALLVLQKVLTINFKK